MSYLDYSQFTIMPLNLPVFQLRTSVGFMADARRRKTGGESRAKRASQVEIITDAKRSPLQGWHHRRKVYTVLQLLRIPILILAAVTMLLTHNVALSVCVAVVSLPLPWVAVLLANESGQVDETTNKVYKPAAQAVRSAGPLRRAGGTAPRGTGRTRSGRRSGSRWPPGWRRCRGSR